MVTILPVSFEFTGSLVHDEAAQERIRDHFDRALRVHLANIPPEGSNELAFVEAWKEVVLAYPEWAAEWGATRPLT